MLEEEVEGGMIGGVRKPASKGIRRDIDFSSKTLMFQKKYQLP